ncbi:MAG: ATP-binding cassette domain-containing protein [Gemmatimonadetes bacterium]|nr:ATP-binding cassette domain-containing protein [Gemmatimonadota bacterium]
MIEYRKVHKRFDRPVLTGVSLSVERGEMLALVGPSGTGKSILLKTTIRLITPDAGDVLVDGESSVFCDARTLERIRCKVGYVFQNAALFDSMTVFDNVALGIHEGMTRSLSRREMAAQVAEALEHVNLVPREVMSKLPADLSGGMRKRVGVARAIVGRPKILLWDEATTGLDPVNLAAVERLMVQLNRELDVTSFIVTHDVQGALEICDRVAMLEGGRIRFVGPPSGFRASDDPAVRAFVDREAATAALDVLELV